MSDIETRRSPWLRVGVSIGTIPAYLLLVHLLGGIVYRAMQSGLTQVDRLVSAGVWAVLGAIVVGGLGVLLSRRGTLYWWVAPVIGLVALAELVIVVVALFVPGGEAPASALLSLASPRFWAVHLWMPLTLALCVAPLRRRSPVRAALIGVIPYLAAGLVFITMLWLGLF
ncbi:hypothetical protein SAMN04489806_0959 [Paramicrobacterium humi]|uniref:Uncharacterized protein n=1 Tax=Paramicrobacterium humi TaxID=640635 RepID=A0A1H4K1D6_9MICO|nr:hypothetical protein [Microbacterium humi]SEB52106.1 hypothetical protein SAMN04489806_0959 [Microbacterium humi]